MLSIDQARIHKPMIFHKRFFADKGLHDKQNDLAMINVLNTRPVKIVATKLSISKDLI